MIRAVFFDLYNTTARFYPPRELVQAQAAQEFGLALDRGAIVRGYSDADELMTEQNAKMHFARLPPDEQQLFFTRYEQLVLKGAGVDASDDLAWRIWDRVRKSPNDLVLYDDTIPCLRDLKASGMVLGLISNLDGDLDAVSKTLGLEPYLAFTVSSKLAGAEKPSPRIFQVALARAGVSPEEAVHVGDQYHGDVAGARAAGVYPVLLDRDGLLSRYADVPRIRGLDEVSGLLAALPV